MPIKKISVEGLTCNHCKMSIENNILKLEGIDSVIVDLSSGHVTIEGSAVNLASVEETVNRLGYKYNGVKQ